MHEDARPWVERSDYDLASAEAMARENRDFYVLFCCQRAVEKRLKAVCVHQTGQMPERTHDLLRLADQVGMQLPAEDQAFLRVLVDYYVNSRYPESGAAKPVCKERLQAYLDRTRKVLQWCDQQIR